MIIEEKKNGLIITSKMIGTVALIIGWAEVLVNLRAQDFFWNEWSAASRWHGRMHGRVNASNLL